METTGKSIIIMTLLILFFSFFVVQSQDEPNIIDELLGDLENIGNKVEILRSGNRNEVKKLLDEGLKINENIDMFENTPLYFAAENENIEVIKLILEERKNIKIDNLISAFMQAVKSNENPEVIKFMISNGLDVNHKDKNSGDTPILNSVWNDNTQIVKVLLDNGADVNSRNNKGETALIKAAIWSGNLNTIKVLLENGADINARDIYGNSALLYSVQGKIGINAVRLLIENDCNVNVRNKIGFTPIMRATEDSILGINKKINKIGILNLLLKNGAKIPVELNNGMTALIHAVMVNSEPEVIKFLLDNGSDIHHKDSRFGNNALMWAAFMNDNPEVIKLLIDYGANVKEKNKDGKNAFELANDNPKIKGTDVYWKINDLMYE